MKLFAGLAPFIMLVFLPFLTVGQGKKSAAKTPDLTSMIAAEALKQEQQVIKMEKAHASVPGVVKP